MERLAPESDDIMLKRIPEISFLRSILHLLPLSAVSAVFSAENGASRFQRHLRTADETPYYTAARGFLWLLKDNCFYTSNF